MEEIILENFRSSARKINEEYRQEQGEERKEVYEKIRKEYESI